MSRLHEAIVLTSVVAFVVLVFLSAIFHWVIVMKISVWILGVFAACVLPICLIKLWKPVIKEIKQKRKEREESEAGK